MCRLNRWELKIMTFRILHCPGTGCSPFHQPLNISLIPQDQIKVAMSEQEASISGFPLSLQHIHTSHITNTTLASLKRSSPYSGRWLREGPGTRWLSPQSALKRSRRLRWIPRNIREIFDVKARSWFEVIFSGFGILKIFFYLTGEPVGSLWKGGNSLSVSCRPKHMHSNCVPQVVYSRHEKIYNNRLMHI